MNRLVLVCALVSAAAACQSQPEQAAPTRRWAIDSVPLLEIRGSGPDGEVWLAKPAGAARLSNGTIVVGDALTRSVIFFDDRGAFIRRTGREGRGPGEFSSIYWLAQCRPDSVFVWDPPQGKMSVIDSEGTIDRSFPIPRSYMATCNRHGDVVLVTWPGPTTITVDGSVKLSGDLLRLDATGRATAPLMRVPLLLHYPAFPLEPATSIAVSQNRIYIGTQDSAYVEAYALDGQPMGAIPVGVESRPASQEHFMRAVDAIVYAVPRADLHEDVRRQILATVTKPEMLPPYGALFTDPGDMLWIQTSFPGDPETTLRGISEADARQVDISFPRSVTVLEIGLDYVLATYEAANGEPCIAMYRLDRTDPSRGDAT